MPARNAHRVDHLGAQFIGQLAQLFRLQAAQIIGCVDKVEKGGVRRLIHKFQPYTRKLRLSM